MTARAKSASRAWLDQLHDIIAKGDETSPRGQGTTELLQSTLRVDMNYPALVCPTRRPSYRFMAAEAFWILSGDDRVATIEPYNSNIARFSDDGERFFGAYGPHIVAQLPYVIRTLGEDRDTRQAYLRIWQDNPPPTKDVPCTLMLGWTIRGGEIHCHAFMRSSDVWLGVPYDVFNFSILSAYIRDQLAVMYGEVYPLGTLHLTAASSHLYDRNFYDADHVLTVDDSKPCEPIPDNWGTILASLRWARDSSDAFKIGHLDGAWNFWEAAK